MSFKDWITYVLEKLVWVMETPRQTRKEQRLAKREPWSSRWFGMIPLSVRMVTRRVRKK